MTDEMWLELAKGQFRHSENPTEEQLNAKVQELKNAQTQKENDRISAHNKLKALGLTDAEIEAL